MERFCHGHAFGSDWKAAVADCVAQLGGLPAAANVGFVYVAEGFVEALDLIARDLAARTSVPYWIGTGGFGVCATGREYMGEPAIAVLIGYLPEDRFALFDGLRGADGGLAPDVADWVGEQAGTLAVVHADARHPDLPDALVRLARATRGFLVGGLGTGAGLQMAGEATAGGLSGILIAAEQPVLTGLTQGCRPLGPFRAVTAGRGPLIGRLDDRPALEALFDDLGDADPRETLPLIHAALRVEGSDRPDYLVRNLVGIDPNGGGVVIGAAVEPGVRVAFVRRDPAAAWLDLERMLEDLRKRVGDRPIRGALYHACVARGRHMFGPGSRELGLIRERLGDVPLAGFFANGEIFRDRLYGYTGILTVFL